MDKKYIPSPKITVGVIQMNSSENIQKNLEEVNKLLTKMKTMPDILVLPEMFNYRKQGSDKEHYSETINGPTIQWLKEVSINKKVWILAGSIAETSNESGKSYNTCFVLNPNGEIIEKYRKMHLFDAMLNNKKIHETNHFLAGDSPKIIEILGWKIGLAICYDLRFPELFQYYFHHKVDAVILPSSFTYQTGEKHWHILCRARAIENQCYFIAPNQYGIGAGGKETYGHSLVVNPNGEIITEIKSAITIIKSCDLLYEEITNFRRQLPVIQHKREKLNTFIN